MDIWHFGVVWILEFVEDYVRIVGYDVRDDDYQQQNGMQQWESSHASGVGFKTIARLVENQ